MIIYPAIDLRSGQCVRLTQGDFDQTTIYETNPIKQAKTFADAGAEWMHMVDLDGAKAGESQQVDLVIKVAEEVPLKIQMGGGIRSEKTIERLLGKGIQRVVIGSLAVKNRELVKNWMRHFGPDHITLAFDIRFTDGQPEILTQGWQAGSQTLLWDVLDFYDGSGMRHVLCTDVSRDGMLTGTNHELYQMMQERWAGLEVMASGGVDGVEDLLALAKLGLSGAIVGKAIYEGKIDLADALKQAANVS